MLRLALALWALALPVNAANYTFRYETQPFVTYTGVRNEYNFLGQSVSFDLGIQGEMSDGTFSLSYADCGPFDNCFVPESYYDFALELTFLSGLITSWTGTLLYSDITGDGLFISMSGDTFVPLEGEFNYTSGPGTWARIAPAEQLAPVPLPATIFLLVGALAAIPFRSSRR